LLFLWLYIKIQTTNPDVIVKVHSSQHVIVAGMKVWRVE
jgi:hypothetical protein